MAKIFAYEITCEPERLDATQGLQFMGLPFLVKQYSTVSGLDDEDQAILPVNVSKGAAKRSTVSVIEQSVPNLNVIGPQVRKLREAKGWTQDELAAKLQLFGWDTSRVSVTKLETRSRRVPDLELFILGKVLGVSTDELFPHNLFGKMKELWPRYRVKLSRGQVPPA